MHKLFCGCCTYKIGNIHNHHVKMYTPRAPLIPASMQDIRSFVYSSLDLVIFTEVQNRREMRGNDLWILARSFRTFVKLRTPLTARLGKLLAEATEVGTYMLRVNVTSSDSFVTLIHSLISVGSNRI
ncbi:hypothetical protein FKM82_027497 [Ascaphus truei]